MCLLIDCTIFAVRECYACCLFGEKLPLDHCIHSLHARTVVGFRWFSSVMLMSLPEHHSGVRCIHHHFSERFYVYYHCLIVRTVKHSHIPHCQSY